MLQSRPSSTFECATCHAEIAHTPTFYVGLPFCCAGCVVGGPCICSYDDEPGDDLAKERLETILDGDRGALVAAVE